jgi:hypothetical protein
MNKLSEAMMHELIGGIFGWIWLIGIPVWLYLLVQWIRGVYPWYYFAIAFVASWFCKAVTRSYKSASQKALSESKNEKYEIVSKYGDLMQSDVMPAPACIADISKLPYKKDEIKNAIIGCLKEKPEQKMVNALVEAYMSLAWFQEGVGKNNLGLDARKLSYNPDQTDDDVKFNKIAQEIFEMKDDRYEKFKALAFKEEEQLKNDLSFLEQ